LARDWTNLEVETLRRLTAEKKTAREIGVILQRSKVSVERKRKAMRVAELTSPANRDKHPEGLRASEPTTATPTPPPDLDSYANGELKIERTINKQVQTLDDLIEQCKIDVQAWEVVSYECASWPFSIKNDDGEIEQVPCYRVKARMKPRKDVLQAKTIIEEMVKEATETLPAPIPRLYVQTADPHLAVINIFDAHLGKLAWAEETGENYDLKIATQDFQNAVEALLRKMQPFDVERIVFPIGNDFLQTDNLAGTTTKGTRVDSDGRFQRVYRIGRQVLTWAISKALEVAPVDAVIVPGNHDQQSAFTLGDSLECWFRKDPDVNVRNEAKTRKYVEWNGVLLGFTHGDKEKKSGLGLMMAQEAREAWARTTWREWHLGHEHTAKLQEQSGVYVRSNPSISGTDAWHHQSGYVGNQRSCGAFLYDPEGLVANVIHTVRKSA
jgi:hypothetical protein